MDATGQDVPFARFSVMGRVASRGSQSLANSLGMTVLFSKRELPPSGSRRSVVQRKPLSRDSIIPDALSSRSNQQHRAIRLGVSGSQIS